MATRSKDRSLFGGAGRYGRPADSDSRAALEKDLSAQVDRVEKDINELRSQYELYYMGVEKLEPVAQRDLIKTTLRRWQELRPRSTALRFRIQQLKARMVSLENYWQRTNRQREAGNYRRDQARVMRLEQRRRQQEAAAQPPQGPMTVVPTKAPPDAPEGREMSSHVLERGRLDASTHQRSLPASSDGPVTPRPVESPAAGSMARPRARSAEDLTEPKLRKLYQTYVGARKRCGETVDLRYEDMAAALRKQVPRLIQSTGAKSVEFKVVIRQGKAVLKAMPKR